MVEVHYSETMQQAFNRAYEWYGQHHKCVKANKRTMTGFKFITHNGDEIFFMTYRTYQWWCQGRTYFMSGKWYHSDHEISGGDNGFKG